MNKLSFNAKVSVVSGLVAIVIVAVLIFTYIVAIPALVSDERFLNYLSEAVKEQVGADLVVEKPVLKTRFSPVINFKTDKISLIKNGKTLLDVENFDTEFSLAKIFQKKIILRKLGSDEIFADINALQTLTFKEQEKEQKPSEFKVDWLSSLLYVKKCMILYKANDKVSIKLLAKDLEITSEREPKHIHFGIFVEINNQNDKLRLGFKDFDKVYIKDKKLIVDNFEFIVNRSRVYIDSVADEKKFDFRIHSNNYDIKSINQFLNSNLLIPNGSEVLACFKDLKGNIKFDFRLTNKGLNGQVDVNKIDFKLIPLANMPVSVTSGKLTMDSKNIDVQDFKGYYDNRIANVIEMSGKVNDYTKKVDTILAITGDATNNFANYVSKLANCNITLKGKTPFALRVLYDVSGKVEVAGGAKVPAGSDILIENMSISPNKFDRALGINLILKGNDVEIKHLNYYIADAIASNIAPTKPMITLKGKLNAVSGAIKELEFDIPEPLPSEFFNVIASQRLFKNGTISGNLKYLGGKKSYLDGNMAMKGVRIVGQKFSIKNGTLTTNRDTVHLTANGRFRRTNYTFDGDIKNEILFPIIVKNINLNIEDLDVERVIQSFAPRDPNRKIDPKRLAEIRKNAVKSNVSTKYFEVEEKTTTKTVSENDDPIEFQPNLVAIEKCQFNVKKGEYKDIKFGNLHANLTLTKAGVLEIKSNKFDFAEGISTLKVYCDLAKEKYSIRLGAKDVESNLIASTMLNLPNEISGKSKALLEFYTDHNAKLNGSIRFAINDGSITKLGLVQYVLNMAALFRNPIVMISPSTIVDLVNIPEGSFKLINGEMKIRNNVIERMMIKSSSPQLSSFIIGRIDLETFDSSLRIYTKFSNRHKGFAGFLRGLSLNALAKKASSFTSPPEEVSYYATELSQLPKLETGEENAQVFLTTVDGDVQTTNFLSSLKKVK